MKGMLKIFLTERRIDEQVLTAVPGGCIESEKFSHVFTSHL
jgi:hypothetical protein